MIKLRLVTTMFPHPIDCVLIKGELWTQTWRTSCSYEGGDQREAWRISEAANQQTTGSQDIPYTTHRKPPHTTQEATSQCTQEATSHLIQETTSHPTKEAISHCTGCYLILHTGSYFTSHTGSYFTSHKWHQL